MKRKLLAFLVVLVSISILGVLFYSLTQDEKKESADLKQPVQTTDTAPQEVIETSEKVEVAPDEEQKLIAESPIFTLYEGFHYEISSEENHFGESIEVLKQLENAYFVKGEYIAGLSFYRIYLEDNEGWNIQYEVTNDSDDYFMVDELVEGQHWEQLFQLESNQEFFLLKTPYKKDTTWGYGSIVEETTIQTDSGVPMKGITVEFENGNKYYYSQEFGLYRIDYFISPTLQKQYQTKYISAYLSKG